MLMNTFGIQAEVKEMVLRISRDEIGCSPAQMDQLSMVRVVEDCNWLAGTAGTWSTRTITVRLNMTVLKTEKDYRDTLVHEWAHAVAAIRFGVHGHGQVWKNVARSLGDDGARCHTIKLAEKLPGRYTSYACPCGQHFNLSYRVVAKIKGGQRRWCRKCKTSISLDKQPAAIAAETTAQTKVGYPTTCNCCGMKVYFSGRRIGFLRKGRVYTHVNCGGAFKEG